VLDNCLDRLIRLMVEFIVVEFEVAKVREHGLVVGS
jgi:hypothetical protein